MWLPHALDSSTFGFHSIENSDTSCFTKCSSNLCVIPKRSALLLTVILGSYFIVSCVLMLLNPSSSHSPASLRKALSARFPLAHPPNRNSSAKSEFVPAYGEIDVDHRNESSAFIAAESLVAQPPTNHHPHHQKDAAPKPGQSSLSVNETVNSGEPPESSDGRKSLNRTRVGSSVRTPEEEKRRELRTKTRDSTVVQLDLCPEESPELIGHMKQAVLLIPTLKMGEVVKSHPGLKAGGAWNPPSCRARHKIAIILPFRDRQSHLNRLLDYMIPMLQRQQLDFRFIVTEQYGHDLFNKGRIMNAAFEVAESMGVDCVMFHDVDMFPQDDRNFYGCSHQPRHLGAFVNSLGYELWYDYIVGGVLVIRCDHFRQVNGYSNMYWAWGGEDDDMGKRILANNFRIERPNKEYSKYTMLKHIKRTRTAPSLIYKLLASAGDRWKTDGLSNHQWRIIKLTKTPLYYHLFVDVGVPPEEWRKA